MTLRPWPLPSRQALILMGVGVVTLAACAFQVGLAAPSEPKPRKPSKPRPAPRGMMIGGSARVCVYSDEMHGSPTGVPFAKVSGAYRLLHFPYAAPGHSASVLFFRRGHAPAHVTVATPKPNATAPWLGKTALLPLPARMGCLAGLLLEGSERGIERYRKGAVVITPTGDAEGGLTAKTQGEGLFRRALSPGTYRVAVVGTTLCETITVTRGRTSFVVFDLPRTKEPAEKTGEPTPKPKPKGDPS